MRWDVVGGLEVTDLGNHFAAALVGREVFEDSAATVEHADASGTADLVAAEREEIAADGLHVERQVAGALGGIDDGDDALLARTSADVGDGIHHSHRVRDVRQREKLHAARELFVEPAEVERAFIAGYGDVVELCTGALRDHLPGDEVAVVFQLGEENDIAGLEIVQRPGFSDEIDAFGGAAREDDFLRGASVDEPGDSFAGAFVGGGGAIAQLVDAAMDVRILVLVVVLDGLEDGARFLGGGAVVEVDQRMSVDLLAEDGEILAKLFPVDCSWPRQNHDEGNLAALSGGRKSQGGICDRSAQQPVSADRERDDGAGAHNPLVGVRSA